MAWLRFLYIFYSNIDIGWGQWWTFPNLYLAPGAFCLLLSELWVIVLLNYPTSP